jgi:hypothetical protein
MFTSQINKHKIPNKALFIKKLLYSRLKSKEIYGYLSMDWIFWNDIYSSSLLTTSNK